MDIIKLAKTNIGRLRIVGFLEGTSLLALIFIGVPLKYYFDSPGFTKSMGPVHGVLFLLFVMMTIVVSVEHNWKFFKTTLKVLISSFIPFGTFYIDKTIFRKMDQNQA